MGLRFNPPPGWPPAPEGFVPPPGWQPDPSWPPPPAGWLLWVPDDSGPGQPPSGQPPSGQETYTQPPTQPPSGGATPPGQSWPPSGQQAYSSDPTGMPGQQQFGPQQFGPQQFGQAPYTYPYGGPPATGRANGLAIASFLLSLLGFTLITLLLSVIFGIIALARIRAQPQRGRGLAIAGLVISGLWIVLIGGLIALGAR